MADAYELISELRDSFHKRCDNDKKLKKITEKLAKGTYTDAHDYSVRVGELLSESFNEVLTAEIYPDITPEIARQVIPSLLGTDHKMISKACATVQEHLNKEAHIGLNAVEPEYDVGRTYDLAEKYVGYDDYEKARWVLDEPVQNFSQSIVDNSVRKNADLHYKSGLSPKIVRRAESGACKWCREVAGTYDYKDVRDKGNDVYRRHEDCRCMVDYDPGNGKRQDVWSKAEWIGDNLEARKKAIEEIQAQRKSVAEYRLANQKRRSAMVEKVQKELGYSAKGASIWVNQNKNLIDKYGIEYMLDYTRISNSQKKSKNSHINLASGGDGTYNKSPQDLELEKMYERGVKTGWISALCGFENYKSVYDRITAEIIGKTTNTGITITSVSEHFMQRIIGTSINPSRINDGVLIITSTNPQGYRSNSRSGVGVEDIKQALFEGHVRKNKKTSSGLTSVTFWGDNAAVTINPDTGKLVQCNLLEAGD